MQRIDYRIIQNATSAFSGSGVFVPTRDNRTVFDGAGYRTRLMNGDFADLPMLVGNNDNEGSILIALYPGSTPNNVTTFGFTCPSALLAQSRSAANVSVWQYRYLGLFPSLLPIPSLGVYHSSEIPLVFGTYNQSTLGNATAGLIRTSAEIQGAWAAFANNPQSGLTSYGWPVYNASGNTLIELGYANSTTRFVNSTLYNDACNLPIMLSRGN